MANLGIGDTVETNAIASLGRRKVMQGAAATAAGAVLTGVSSPALAAVGAALQDDSPLNTFEGAYALAGGAIVHGFFTSPRNKTGLGVVVMLPGTDGLTNALKAKARRQALGGSMVFVPDLRATPRRMFTGGSHDAAVANIVALAPGFRRHMHGNGTVRFVAAA